MNACAKRMTGGCVKPNAKGSTSLMLHDGLWYCLAHLPDRGYRTNCSHSLGFGLGKCPYCGKPG